MHARASFLSLILAGLCAACSGPGVLHEVLTTPAAKKDALTISDALEDLIAEGKDSAADRQFAYDQIRAHEEDTAAYAFARAAITGRYVQGKGLTSAPLVRDVERFARRSRELDPGFRSGAATRMLGTLYVLAPATLLAHGDSEQGLTMLQHLLEAHPEIPENHLRVAEALIALGDPAPAAAHLCYCVAKKAALRHDEQLLLEHLIKDAEMGLCPASAP
ncbi:MAG: hypothetical protein ABI193_25865 [Minicystis sp.]